MKPLLNRPADPRLTDWHADQKPVLPPALVRLGYRLLGLALLALLAAVLILTKN